MKAARLIAVAVDENPELAGLARQVKDRAASFVANLYIMRNAERQTELYQTRVVPAAQQFGVDPVRWTPFPLRRRCHQWRRVTDPMHRNSGDRWLIWSDLGAPRRRCRASSNRPPRRSGTGFVRPIAMKAADRTARPAPSARS